LDEDFAGGEGRSGWSDGIGIGASYTPRVGLVGHGARPVRALQAATNPIHEGDGPQWLRENGGFKN
jgi:hypothetical protein